MPTKPSGLPDLSVDFLTWINAELRKRIEQTDAFEDEQAKNASLVKRLKNYLSDRLAAAV